MSEFTTHVVERIKLGSRIAMPSGVHGLELAEHRDLALDQLCLEMRAFVYGQSGQVASGSKTYCEARLPRWLPRRLRARWSRWRTVTVDVTPLLVWPDATFVPPEFGSPVRIIRTPHVGDDDV